MKLKNKLSIFLLIGGVLLFTNKVTPNFIKSTTSKSKIILAEDETVLRITLSADEKARLWKPLDQLNPKFIDLILRKEDRFFYFHYGVNPVSFLRSTINYMIGKSTGGASTITMQLARLYFKLKTRTIGGKFKQLIFASLLELTHSKSEILEAYLNMIPMGGNIEGLESAARIYLGKKNENLKLSELKVLVNLPQSPKRVSEYFNLKENSDPIVFRRKMPFRAPHFTDLLLKRFKQNTIHSSLNWSLQKNIDHLVKDYINNQKNKGVHNATALIIDSERNQIISYIGSKDFFDQSIDGQVDGIQAKRSPGSTLKPFIYGLGMDQGLIIPQTIVNDAPLKFRTPENYDGKYKGPMTIEKALITSRNIPAVFVNSKLKEPDLYTVLKHSGVEVNFPKTHYGSSIALGSLEVSPFELGTLYNMLANNGEVHGISILSKAKRNKNPPSLISPEASVMIKDILGKNPRPGFDKMETFTENLGKVHWKTGTSFGFRDAWSVGVWSKYTIVVWVGDFRGKSNPYLIGSEIAGPLLFKIIDYMRSSNLYDDQFDLRHEYAKGLNVVNVCTVSGKVPMSFCPHTRESLFIPGVSPIEECNTHRKVEVSKKTGLRTCPKSKGDKETKVFEFYTTEKLKLFSSFGLKLKLPPRFSPECNDYIGHEYQGEKPIIVSPKHGFKYIPQTKEAKAKIPFLARADVENTHVSWYVDDEFIGKTKPGEYLYQELKHGRYIVKVVDEFGRVSKRVLTVENQI